MRSQTVLSLRDVNVEHATKQQRIRLVDKVSLDVRRGEVLGIIGESGSGKTMTCMAVMGLLPHGVRMTGGAIILNGGDIAALPQEGRRILRGSRLSMIMQNPMACFNPVRTIGAHFIETVRLHSEWTKNEAREMAEHHLGQVNLLRPRELLKQYPYQLSGGMLQRVMIAIALATKPDVLIADEPTTALDAGNRKHILHELNRVREMTDAALIVITHDLSVIAELADHVTVMHRGEVVETAPVTQLFDVPEHPYTRLLLESRISALARVTYDERKGTG